VPRSPDWQPDDYAFKEFTPCIKPKYSVVAMRFEVLYDTAIPPEVYYTWMPPYTRFLYVQTLDSNLLGEPLPSSASASTVGKASRRE